MRIFVCIPLCTTVVHNAAWSSSDNIPPLPPDDHHGSDEKGSKILKQQYITQYHRQFTCTKE